MQSTHALPGAHAFVQRYAPANSKSNPKSNPKSKYLPSSVSFGARVDAYLEEFVDQGYVRTTTTMQAYITKHARHIAT